MCQFKEKDINLCREWIPWKARCMNPVPRVSLLNTLLYPTRPLNKQIQEVIKVLPCFIRSDITRTMIRKKLHLQ